MTTIKSRRYAALFAAAFLTCALLGHAKVSHAQPPPPPPTCDTCTCWNCLQPVLADTNNLCGGCGHGCITWGLENFCDSCIDTITLMTKFGDPFSTCCVAVDSASHGTWTYRPLGINEVQFTATSGCLNQGRVLLITTCGITPGEDIYLYWSPGQGPNPPCDTLGGHQGFQSSMP